MEIFYFLLVAGGGLWWCYRLSKKQNTYFLYFLLRCEKSHFLLLQKKENIYSRHLAYPYVYQSLKQLSRPLTIVNFNMIVKWKLWLWLNLIKPIENFTR